MFLRMDPSLSCLDLFQSMLTKIMFVLAVLCSSGCSSGTVPEPAEPVEVDHTDNMAFLDSDNIAASGSCNWVKGLRYLLRVFVERVCCGNGFGGEHKFGWMRTVRWVGV